MKSSGNKRWAGLLVLAALGLAAGCRETPTGPSPAPAPALTPAPAPTPAPAVDAGGWVSLFDGKTLGRWEVTQFGGQGDVRVEDDRIILDVGPADLTGITWTEEPLRMNYEVELEAMRVDGSDFFCGLTVPVRYSCVTLIVGGWGGSLVGLSSLGGMDASENETTRIIDFENGRWYRIRMRVTQKKIEAWIDDEQTIDAEPGEREISVRWEVELSQPLGIAAWRTKAAMRNIRVRPLPQ